MTGEQFRVKRVLARIPGHMISQRAGVGRGRLSEIERGQVSAPPEELARIEHALDALIEAKEKMAEVAAEVGWPLGAL